jgi:tetratricopeptide (TPR) repeat protein
VNLFFGFFGLVAYLVFSFSDFPSERAPHLFMLSLLLALVFQNKSGSQNSAVKLLVPVILGLGLLFGLFLVSQRWKGESATHAVLEANRTQNARAIVPAVEEALNPYYNVDPYANPLHYYSSLGYAFSGQTDAALEACREARKNAPYNILVYNAYANTYARRREADKALAYLDTAITISPKYKQALLLKAELLLDQKRFDEALDALNMHDPESDDRRYLQALARALRGSLRTYPQHGRFRPMMEYLQQQPRLEQPMDYVRAYKAKRGVN